MTHTDLIQRLEEATEGSRQADMEIADAIGWTHVPPALSGPECWLDENGLTQAMLPDYTTSRDAALPWENIEQVALHEVVEGEPLGTVWEAWHVDPETQRRTMGAGWTEAIARRVAALKARETKE